MQKFYKKLQNFISTLRTHWLRYLTYIIAICMAIVYILVYNFANYGGEITFTYGRISLMFFPILLAFLVENIIKANNLALSNRESGKIKRCIGFNFIFLIVAALLYFPSYQSDVIEIIKVVLLIPSILLELITKNLLDNIRSKVARKSIYPRSEIGIVSE